MKNILDNLNDAQREAVKQMEGPVIVIAGAGSGKTRVLTYKIAYLLENEVNPFNILALTFTNKAAKEMQERILTLIGNSAARNVWMGTFHSIFARILRKESDKLGYTSNYSIYDNDDSKRIIKSIIKEQNLDDKVYNPNFVLNRISSAKTNLISFEEYNENPDIQNQDRSGGKGQLGFLYKLYQQRCYRASAMDFDDLLFNTNKLLRDFPETLYKYQQKFKYILVDEYQDTNHAQYSIIKKLAANNENICVVGDDAQSIYAFRGATIQNILNFKNDYPDFRMFKLEQNYRSTQAIVKAANSVISNNKNQYYKEIWTDNEPGENIKILKAPSDNEEGMMIANSIFDTVTNNNLQNNDFAVLYRTNAQSRAIEEALRKLNIPYRIYGGLSFYKRKEIKDILAYFRLAVNLFDEDALMRIINYPQRGIGDTTTGKIIIAGNESNKKLWDILCDIANVNINLSLSVKNRISDFVTMIKSFNAQLKTRDAYYLAKEIVASSGILKELYDDKTPEGLSRFENIEELLGAIKEFCESKKKSEDENEGVNEGTDTIRTLDEFMQEISLLTNEDKDDKTDINRVSLMTIHSAKGLEFPYVYIAGVEENLFPSIQSLHFPADLEEERRLFYVALTRAMKHAVITYADSRYKWGDYTICEPSRFISEIDNRYVEMPYEKKPVKTKKTFTDTGLFIPEKIILNTTKKLKKITTTDSNHNTDNNDLCDKIQVGMEVEHERFGKGKVISVEGINVNKKATVFFSQHGQKQLLLKFTKLKILN